MSDQLSPKSLALLNDIQACLADGSGFRDAMAITASSLDTDVALRMHAIAQVSDGGSAQFIAAVLQLGSLAVLLARSVADSRGVEVEQVLQAVALCFDVGQPNQ